MSQPPGTCFIPTSRSFQKTQTNMWTDSLATVLEAARWGEGWRHRLQAQQGRAGCSEGPQGAPRPGAPPFTVLTPYSLRGTEAGGSSLFLLCGPGLPGVTLPDPTCPSGTLGKGQALGLGELCPFPPSPFYPNWVF